jgi:hypothetical protein
MTHDVLDKFQVHYYFEDSSHTMNAFVRNQAEKDLLNATKLIFEALEIPVEINTEAYQEGGLVETLTFCVLTREVLKFLAPAINQVIVHRFTTSKLDIKIKEENLRKLKLENQDKEIDLEAKKSARALEDRAVSRHLSNYYKKIEAYKKVTSIGFKSVDTNSSETIVKRDEFSAFILKDDIDIQEDDDALIEIISPVLKEGNYKWRGRYKNEKIEFSLADTQFKNEVIAKKHLFSNGFSIKCLLQIKTTYDEFGDEKKRSYSVKEVLGTRDVANSALKLRDIGHQREMEKKQDSLFDDL